MTFDEVGLPLLLAKKYGLEKNAGAWSEKNGKKNRATEWNDEYYLQ